MKSAQGSGHDDYVASRRRLVAQLAEQVLSGSLSAVEGGRQVANLRHELGLPEDDPDLLVFTLIESETDDLPLGGERANWSLRALTQKQPDLSAAESWAKETGLEAFRNLVRCFGAA
jgi:hypothetical protein